MNARIFGWILLVFVFLADAQQVASGSANVVLAFCYFGVLVAAAGFLLDRPALVYVYASIGLVAQVPFSIDLVRTYLGLQQIFGFVAYAPLSFPLVGRIVDLSVHLLALPIALVGMAFVRVPRLARIVSWLFVLTPTVLIASWLVGGVNCVWIGCFAPLPFGLVLFGHVFYLLLASIGLPIPAAMLLRACYMRLRKGSERDP